MADIFTGVDTDSNKFKKRWSGRNFHGYWNLDGWNDEIIQLARDAVLEYYRVRINTDHCPKLTLFFSDMHRSQMSKCICALITCSSLLSTCLLYPSRCPGNSTVRESICDHTSHQQFWYACSRVDLLRPALCGLLSFDQISTDG